MNKTKTKDESKRPRPGTHRETHLMNKMNIKMNINYISASSSDDGNAAKVAP